MRRESTRRPTTSENYNVRVVLFTDETSAGPILSLSRVRALVLYFQCALLPPTPQALVRREVNRPPDQTITFLQLFPMRCYNISQCTLKEPPIRCRRGICRCITRQLDRIIPLSFFLLSFLFFPRTLLLLTVLIRSLLPPVLGLVGFKSAVRRRCQGGVNRLGGTL